LRGLRRQLVAGGMSGMTAQDFASLLASGDLRVSRAGAGWTGQCPSHDDRQASLAISEGQDGRVLVCCHAGCSFEDIARACGLEPSAFFAQRDEPSRPPRKPAKTTLPTEAQVATYARRLAETGGAVERLLALRAWSPDAVREMGLGLDDDGRVSFPVRDASDALIGVLSYQPNPERRNGTPKMLAVKGSKRGLFPAPERVPGDELWIVEGEPDAVAAHTLGLPAVALPGVGKTDASWWPRLAAGRQRVVIVADCDEPGRTKSSEVADALIRLAPDVRVLDLAPGRADGHDLGDELLLAMPADANERGQFVEMVRALAVQSPCLSPTPIDGDDLLEEIGAFIRRFVVVPDDNALTALVLWVVHTHAMDAADTTPYLAITSPEPGCGKTQSLEVLQMLTARAWKLSGAPTEAVLFRKIEQDSPTVLIDEIDRLFKGASERTEPLTAILNGGNRRGSTVPRCVGEGTKMTVKDFRTFGAKALTGIDHLKWPDTIRDRCIAVRLHKMLAQEKVDRFNPRKVEPDGAKVRRRAERWVQENLEQLRGIEPPDLESLSPRAAAGWEPLQAIAIRIGGEWPAKAERAALALSGTPDTDAQSIGARLLADIRNAFGSTDKISTDDLLTALKDIDDAPWPGWGKGNGLTARQLGGLLRPYEIKSRSIRLPDDRTPKGFLREQFTSAWARYAPDPQTETPHRHIPDKHRENGPFLPATEEGVWRKENGQNPSVYAGCGVVADKTVDRGKESPLEAKS
jgi:hypothetical protein